MIIKSLIQTGNSKAIVLDKAILQAANLDDNSLFAISINPNGVITIQSVENSGAERKQQAFLDIISKNQDILKRLSDR